MSVAAHHCRRMWRRVVRAYHLACARDDAAAHGLSIPSGVWMCRRCQEVLLELTAFQWHLRVAHSAF